MIVQCDNCGKKYRVEPDKIKGREARFKCKSCNQLVTVLKPAPEPELEFALLEESEAGVGIVTSSPPSEPNPGFTFPEADLSAELETVTAEPEVISVDEPSKNKAEAPVRKKGIGLTGKVILLMLLVSLVPLGVFSFITIQQVQDRIVHNQEQLGAQVTEGLTAQVDEWIDKNLRVLKALADMPAIQSMNRLSQETLLKIVHDQYPWMYLVFTTDSLGMNVARNDGNELTDYSDRQYVKDVISGKAVAWQTLIGKTSKKPALVMAVPIQRNGGTVGVMAAAMTIDDISKRIANWRQGQTGFAYLVDEKGKVVAHQVDAYVQEQRSLSTHPLISAFRNGSKGVIEFTTDEGHQAIGQARNTEYGWTLAIQQSKSEAFAALSRARTFALTLLALTVVVVVLIALFSSRSIVNPIKALTDAANRISVGDLDVEIQNQSRDEIGELADAVTRMQDSIRLSIARLRRRRRK
ncbi:MAG: cache domain-containing protein [Desulfobacterales bacterium]